MIKLSLAESFLALFAYETTTIQVFPPLIDGKAHWPKIPGKFLCTGEAGTSAIAYEGKLRKQPFLKDLALMQKQRMGVYFMVNEGDGEFHGHNIVRNSNAVRTLKALFVDTDEGNPKLLNKFCKKKGLKPHIVIESSPGKFHYYFLIEPRDTTKDNVFAWQSCQHRLASIDENYDDSMADIGRVLRIPGFYHTKSDPFLIQEKYRSTHNPYDLTEIFELIGADKTPPRKGSEFIRPENTVSQGARHERLSAYLGSLSNDTIDKDILIDSGIGFAQRYFKDSSSWLPKGNRFKELEDQVDYVISERQKEDLKHTITILETKETEQGFSKLPDEFYLNAPGLIGKMVRELAHYSHQPYPSFCFAVAASLLGTLKAPVYRGELMDAAPATYFLCLASTGRGKDFPREAIFRTASRLGLGSFITQKARSAQGFLRKFSQANGTQLFLHDEAHHLFSQIRSSQNDYITTLKPHLLSLFSSANTPFYDVGAVMAEKSTIPPIPYPVLNYCGFGVPTGFESAFQSTELNEGLMTRFLILFDHKPVIPMMSKELPQKFKFERHLKELSAQARLDLETCLLKNEKNGIKTFKKIRFDPSALKIMQAYSANIAKQRNADTPLIDSLKSRLVEHVNRVSTMIADELITPEIVQFSITLVDHCYSNIERHVDSFQKGQGNRDMEDLLQFIRKRMQINKGPMPAMDLCYFRIRDRATLNNTLQLAVELGWLEKYENSRKGKLGRKGTFYSAKNH